MKMNLKIVSAIFIIIVISFFIYYNNSIEKVSINTNGNNTNDGSINSVKFSCKENKSIQAVFFEDKVELNLSDKRNILLLHALSASGARYANSDESFIFWNKGDTAFIIEADKTTFEDCVKIVINTEGVQINTEIANPASVNCLAFGGNLTIEKNGIGDEYGLCYFEDNRACEEWALMRGDCMVGGVKTTGFDTIDQKYCAWFGGQTLAITNSICTFKDGSKCSTIDFYNNKCSNL